MYFYWIIPISVLEQFKTIKKDKDGWGRLGTVGDGWRRLETVGGRGWSGTVRGRSGTGRSEKGDAARIGMFAVVF
jgi:hypothetical protein